ncbi:hypothetical protein BH18ACT13_BH18ACT13_01330 [soil metagenome]
MEAARPREHRRRARRGTVDRPLNTRLVRVGALVLAPAILALLFSLSPTTELPRPQLEPVFSGAAAATLARELSTEFPSRVPGSDEAASAARWYSETISSLGLQVEEDIWSADLVDLGEVELRNLVTVVPGRSEEAIVLVAHRDNMGAGEPQGENASGTAALIELARGFAPQGAAAAPLPNRTLILLSTDAGAYGGAGAARFARASPHAPQALAAIVLDGLGGGGRPRLAIAGDGSSSPARTLVKTASARVAEQVGQTPAMPSILAQLVDLAVPYAAAEQGPFVAEGIAAISISRDTRGNIAEPGVLSAGRLGQLGRATEALLSSIDTSVEVAFQTPSAVFLESRATSGWVVRLMLIVAVVPFALGILDLVARGRRRGLPFLPALRALRTRLLVWLWAGALIWIGGLTGALPTGTALPLPTSSSFVVDANIAGLAVLALAFVVGWLVARRPLIPVSKPTPEERLAGYTCALTWLGLVALTIALTRPFALVFVLPPLYAWLWLPLRLRRWQRASLYAIGLLGPIGGILLLGHELALGPAEAALYIAGLATVGYVSIFSVLLTIAWLAAAAQLAALVFGRYGPYTRASGLRWAVPGRSKE